MNREIPYIDLVEWRKRFREARIRSDARRRELQEQFEEAIAERERLDLEENLMAQAEAYYAARMENGVRSTRIAGGNLKEVLIINFAAADGVIRGIEASAALVDIGYFSNRQSADGAVYSMLAKPPFVKLDKGVYHVPITSPDWLRLRGSDGTLSQERPQGEVVKVPTRPAYGSSKGRQTSLFTKQIDAIVKVAQENSGAVRSYQATRVLKDKGLFRNPKWVGFDALAVLRKSKKFVKVARGVYHLADQTADFPV